METTPLDPSLPGVRLLQCWIRDKCPLSIDVVGQERIEGRLVWQDPEFLAIEANSVQKIILINRKHVVLIRSLA